MVLVASNLASSVTKASSGSNLDDGPTEKMESKSRLEKKLSTDMLPKSRSSGNAWACNDRRIRLENFIKVKKCG